MTDRYVGDASVVAKWYLQDEAGAEKAASLFRAYIHGEAELAAPFPLRFEVPSAIHKAVRSQRISPGIARALILQFLLLDLPLHESIRLTFHAFEVAERARLTLYDAHYLALAEALDWPLITADIAQKNAPVGTTIALEEVF